MSEFNFKITNYSIHLGERAADKAVTLSGQTAEVTITKVLTCRGEEGERIVVQFFTAGKVQGPFRSLHHQGPDGKPSAIIWEDEANFLHFVDLVRNESPVWGYIESGEGGAEARLYTGHWEPVGVGDEDYHTDPTR